MTEITEADYGGVTDGTKPVLAFPTDSAQGIAMLIEVLAQGATVSRSETAFTAGGKSFPTGTALVDGSTTHGHRHGRALRPAPGAGHGPRRVSGRPQGARGSEDRPLHGCAPGRRPTHCGFGGAAVGHCGTTNQTAFCEMLHALAVNLGLPYQGANQVLFPVTQTQTPGERADHGQLHRDHQPGAEPHGRSGNDAAPGVRERRRPIRRRVMPTARRPRGPRGSRT